MLPEEKQKNYVIPCVFKQWALDRRILGDLFTEFYSMTPPAHGREWTHTHKDTNARLCVCVLWPLLTSSCSSPRALQRWLFPEKGWLDLLCGCLKQRLLTPVTPIPSHGALLLPASSFPSLPPGLVQTWHPICYLHREVRARLAPA